MFIQVFMFDALLICKNAAKVNLYFCEQHMKYPHIRMRCCSKLRSILIVSQTRWRSTGRNYECRIPNDEGSGNDEIPMRHSGLLRISTFVILFGEVETASEIRKLLEQSVCFGDTIWSLGVGSSIG